MSLIFPDGSYTTNQLPAGMYYDQNGNLVGGMPNNSNEIYATERGTSSPTQRNPWDYPTQLEPTGWYEPGGGGNPLGVTPLSNQALSLQRSTPLPNDIRPSAPSFGYGTAVSTAPNYADMVNQAYGSIGRSGIGSAANQIDQEGYDYWTNQLASGAISPEQFQSAFLNAAANYSGPNANTYQPAINTARQLLGTNTTPTTSVASTTTAATTPTTNTATTGTPFGITNPSAITNQFATSTNPYIQAAQATTLGNLAGAQAATTANRVNQTTPYGGVQYQQTGVDAQGNPVWSANQTLAPEFQESFGNIARQIQQNTSQGFNPNLPSVGINPGETYSDAIMRRLQPQLQQQQERLEVQLANQGIMPGSEAYNRAQTQLAQNQNDQLTSAVVGGFNTGLAANQQAYNQAISNYQLPLATLNQFRTATAPSYVTPYNQAAVSGPDYLGAYTTGQNAELAANAANAARQSGITSGLFNLAGTALANPTAVGNLINLGGQALGAIGSGLNSATNWLGNSTGNPLTAFNYGTNLGSQQTQMLANQDSWF